MSTILKPEHFETDGWRCRLFYLRTQAGPVRLAGAVAMQFRPATDDLRLAFSLVSPDDQFSRVVGRQIALGRLKSERHVVRATGQAALENSCWLMQTVGTVPGLPAKLLAAIDWNDTQWRLLRLLAWLSKGPSTGTGPCSSPS